MKTPEQLLADIQSAMTAMDADNKSVIKALKESTALVGADAKAAMARAEELAQKLSGVAASIVEMEQKLAEKVIDGKAPIETLGQLVIKSDAYKQFALGNTGKMTVQANTIIGQEGSPPANSDTIVAPQRLGGIIGGAYRALRVRDLVPQGNTTSNAVEYTRELAFTNNAAETAEGAAKPESALTFELVTCPIATIAHFLKVSKQVLSDAPALASYIDTRLRYGVDVRYDAQILNGNGTGQNISGMTKSGNHTAFTPVTGDQQLDSVNRAIYAVYAQDYAPTGIVMNPADWGAIERLKDNEERYIIGAPQSTLGARLWGLPVVVTNAMTAGKFLVAAFDIAYQVWNRQGTVVEMFEQDSDNVQKNLLTVRAENRGALATYRPASAQYGSLVL